MEYPERLFLVSTFGALPEFSMGRFPPFSEMDVI